MSQALDEIKIGGMGASRKRVEDSRFIRGRGTYIDDIVLPSATDSAAGSSGAPPCILWAAQITDFTMFW